VVTVRNPVPPPSNPQTDPGTGGGIVGGTSSGTRTYTFFGFFSLDQLPTGFPLTPEILAQINRHNAALMMDQKHYAAFRAAGMKGPWKHLSVHLPLVLSYTPALPPPEVARKQEIKNAAAHPREIRLNYRNLTFNCPDEAAMAWTNHYFSRSAFTRHEHGALIYQVREGAYRLTRTASGRVHVAYGLYELHRDTVASGRNAVAFVHTHPEGLSGNIFSSGDRDFARGPEWNRRNINGYVAGSGRWGNWEAGYREDGPRIRVYKYHYRTGEIDRAVNNETYATYRPLDLREQFFLYYAYRPTWDLYRSDICHLLRQARPVNCRINEQPHLFPRVAWPPQ